MISLLFVACISGDQTFGAVNEVTGQDQGTAKLEYDPAVIIISDVEVDYLSSGTIMVTSIGDGALSIDKADISNSAEGAFYMDEESNEELSLLPEVSREFIVTVLMEEAIAHYGEMRIRSNDEEYRDLRIPLCAFPIGFEGETNCPIEEIEEAEDTAEE
jgi:hypothetical protein